MNTASSINPFYDGTPTFSASKYLGLMSGNIFEIAKG